MSAQIAAISGEYFQDSQRLKACSCRRLPSVGPIGKNPSGLNLGTFSTKI
jgi:hypothetical protein